MHMVYKTLTFSPVLYHSPASLLTGKHANVMLIKPRNFPITGGKHVSIQHVNVATLVPDDNVFDRMSCARRVAAAAAASAATAPAAASTDGSTMEVEPVQ
eukprot:645642-Pelagomonas_calceolata.AAC.1